MALKRAFLKALGIEDEKVDEIINAHTETVNGLKDEIEKYKADAEKLPSVQAALDKANETAKSSEKDPFKVKYDALKEEFDGYKADVTKKATTAQKSAAYRTLLDELKINGKITDKVLKLADLEKVELDDKGAIKDADELKESLKTEWADFIVKDGAEGGKVDNPPVNNGGVDTSKMSDAEYFAYQRNKKG